MIIDKDVEINSPDVLRKVILMLQEEVKLKNLKQIFDKNSEYSDAKNIMEIPAEGPWPDYIELYFFSEYNSRTYSLSVETYHGMGGSWQIVR